MNIVAMVSAERGAICLNEIINNLSNNDNLTIFTFKETLWEPPFSNKIQQIARKTNSKFYLTSKVHDDMFKEVWQNHPDLILVIGWRYLIPESVYNSASIGCFVFHDSYLPEYRGFGPSVWAMRNGESYTGATLFQIVEEMDAGPIVEQQKIPIKDDEYIGDIVNKVTDTYVSMIKRLFKTIKNGSLTLREQKHENATYTCKSIPTDFLINWNKSAESIRNLIRAYSSPYPGSYTFLEGEKIVILTADVDLNKKYVGSIPGRVVKIEKKIGVYISTGNGLLLIKDVRINDGSIINASNIIKKISITLG